MLQHKGIKEIFLTQQYLICHDIYPQFLPTSQMSVRLAFITQKAQTTFWFYILLELDGQ